MASGVGLSWDFTGWKKFIARFEDPQIKNELNQLLASREVIAIISQAIADNFNQEGPGWAPLKPETILRSVAKNIRKQIEKPIAQSMGYQSKAQVPKNKRAAFKAALHKDILRHEKLARRPNSTLEPRRMILRRSGLLMRTATTIGYSGSSGAGKKRVQGKNLYRVSNNKLTWGTSLVYAKTQNDGDSSRNIPARPFMRLRAEWSKRLTDYIVDEAKRIVESQLARDEP